MLKRYPNSMEFLILLACWMAGAVQINAQQPVWNATGALSTARTRHTSTLLGNGQVLVVGGLAVANPCCQVAVSVELYNPATGQWSNTSRPQTPRYDHIAVRLTNGKVLIAGGKSGSFGLLASTEIYDPETQTWSLAGNLNTPRDSSQAILLADGKVLITGGLALSTTGLADQAEVYDPATNIWTHTGKMNTARVLHSIARLPNGRVLVAGGLADTILRSSEIFDPSTNNWGLTGELTLPSANRPAALLANGKVLVVGGVNASESPIASAELYDSVTGQWSATGSLTIPRALHALTLLPNGKVIVAGGAAGIFTTLNSAELYDPATGSWTPTVTLGQARVSHTMTLLPNGRVLIAGGRTLIGPTLAGAELFDSGASIITSLSAASFATGRLAPEAIVAGFGATMAASTQTANGLPLPTQLAGVRLRVRDVTGTERDAPLLFVSPSQINYQIPPGTANGPATLTVSSGAVGIVDIARVAPGLFTANANGQGVAAAVALRIKADGSQSFEPVARFDAAQNRFVTMPIDLGPEMGMASDQVFLVLYGTGLRFRSALSAVSITIGGANSEVVFAGPAPGFAGLDQINVRVPRSLAGRGEVDVMLAADGHTANKVRISIR